MEQAGVGPAQTLMIGDTTHDLRACAQRRRGVAGGGVRRASARKGSPSLSPLATVHSVAELRAWLANERLICASDELIEGGPGLRFESIARGEERCRRSRFASAAASTPTSTSAGTRRPSSTGTRANSSTRPSYTWSARRTVRSTSPRAAFASQGRVAARDLVTVEVRERDGDDLLHGGLNGRRELGTRHPRAPRDRRAARAAARSALGHLLQAADLRTGVLSCSARCSRRRRPARSGLPRQVHRDGRDRAASSTATRAPAPRTSSPGLQAAFKNKGRRASC